MSLDNKILQDNFGQCLFPIKDEATGKRKTLCGTPTLLDASGMHVPFCAEHQKEVQKILAYKKNLKQKKAGSFKGGFVSPV